MKKFVAMALGAALAASLSAAAYAEDSYQSGTADITLNAGSLAILPVGNRPPDFAAISGTGVQFEGGEILNVAKTYYAPADVGVVLQDIRGLGVASTWKIRVDLSEFEDEDNNVTLRGAQLILTPSAGTLKPAQAPAGYGLPVQTQVTIPPGGADILLSASSSGSPGVWGADWEPSLVVPASAEAGTHKATLTWTISAGL